MPPLDNKVESRDLILIDTHSTWPEAARRRTGAITRDARMLMNQVERERGDKAFRRLQEEIIKVSADPTISAWSATSIALGKGKPFEEPRSTDINALVSTGDQKSPFKTSGWTVPLLASNPRKFWTSSGLIHFDKSHSSYLYNRFSMTQRGLEINIPLMKDGSFATLAYGNLNSGTHSPSCFVAFPILLDKPLGESKFLETPEGVSFFDNSMPCSFIANCYVAQLATVCLRNPGHKSIPTLDTSFILPSRIRKRYSSFLGYPPCHFDVCAIRVGVATNWLDRFLLWMQDSSGKGKHMFIRFTSFHNRGGYPDWMGEATLFKGPPKIEVFAAKYRDDDFWVHAERYAGHDKRGPMAFNEHFNIPWAMDVEKWHPAYRGTIHLECGQCKLFRGASPQTSPRNWNYYEETSYV